MDPRELIANDRYATDAGIRLVSCGGGEAVLEVTLTERHLNADGFAQGGLIFTLADTAFAVAVNEKGKRDTVTLTSTANYIRPVSTGTLTAKATTVSRGRSTCCVDVLVTNDAGKAVAKLQFTGFTKE